MLFAKHSRWNQTLRRQKELFPLATFSVKMCSAIQLLFGRLFYVRANLLGARAEGCSHAVTCGISEPVDP